MDKVGPSAADAHRQLPPAACSARRFSAAGGLCAAQKPWRRSVHLWLACAHRVLRPSAAASMPFAPSRCGSRRCRCERPRRFRANGVCFALLTKRSEGRRVRDLVFFRAHLLTVCLARVPPRHDLAVCALCAQLDNLQDSGMNVGETREENVYMAKLAEQVRLFPHAAGANGDCVD